MFKKLLLLLIALFVTAITYDAMTLPRYSGPVSDHFDGKRFVSESYNKKKWGDVLRWQLQSNPGAWETRSVANTKPPGRAAAGETIITLINHATVLIQIDGANILTDPIWSEHTGPFGKIGPARYREPGIRFEDLPPIDLVLISHSHYDHMDLPTLRRLNEIHTPLFLVGLGNARHLEKVSAERVVELDWWNSHIVSPDITVTATPAAHWSKRSMLDTNRSLWTSFAISQSGKHHVYFAGDTGYSPHFARIGERLGSPVFALLPIGAYLPEWFMSENHISPSEALDASADLNADTMIPIHFGTFALGDDGQDRPLNDLLAARPGQPHGKLRVLDNGESLRLDELGIKHEKVTTN